MTIENKEEMSLYIECLILVSKCITLKQIDTLARDFLKEACKELGEETQMKVVTHTYNKRLYLEEEGKVKHPKM